MKLAIIGTGYVGLVTGACFADMGHNVICVDKDKDKINSLRKGKIPIYEPGLSAIVKKCVKRKTLQFTDDIKPAVRNAEIIFICVGTPPKKDGSADLTNIEHVSCEIAASLNGYKVIVEKSTVPVETGEWVKRTILAFSACSKKGEVPTFDVASNPEFLREGSAIKDFKKPDRIVIGADSEKARKLLKKLYTPFNAPLIMTDIKGAELIKHASNSFLATKISFINAVANICEKIGADIEEVAEGIGLDKRINKNFLKAGAGFGGFCFPKDRKSFMHMAESLGYEFNMLKEVEKINDDQIELLLQKIKKCIWNFSGKTIAVLGLSFKPNTDDVRFSPSINLIRKLIENGCRIKAYDPCASEKAKTELGNNISYAETVYDAVKGADCLVLMTEWNEFRDIKLSKVKKLMNKPVIVDGRNFFDPKKIKKEGFDYTGIGRRAY